MMESTKYRRQDMRLVKSTPLRDVRRGQIYFVTQGEATAEGSEQAWGRPAVIVSSDEVNCSSAVDVEAVFFTTREKNPLPTHVPVRSLPRPSIALCEQIHTIPRECLGRYAGELTAEEMERVDRALAVSLGLEQAGRWVAPAGTEEEVRRGEAYYVVGDPRNKDDDVQKKKPAVIVSNDTGNHYSTIVEIVFLTKPKRESKKKRPTKVMINSLSDSFTAICGKVHTIDKRRLEERIGRIPEYEMAGIDCALAAGLGLAVGLNEEEERAAAM